MPYGLRSSGCYTNKLGKFETIFGYLHTSGISIMKFNKNPKNTKNSFFLNVCCLMVFYVFLCRSVCWFLYGPFSLAILSWCP